MEQSDTVRPTGGWRLVHFFGLLGCLVALPALLFSAYLIVRFASLERESSEARLEEVVRSLNASIEREVSSSIVTLRLLASAPALEEGDLSAFHHRAQAALAGSEAYVLLADRSAQQLLNTRVPFGSPLGASSDPEHIALAIDSGVVAVSGVFYGKVAQDYVFNVVVPAEVGDRGRHALILTRNVATLADILSASLPGSEDSMAVVDASGQVIVATANSGMESGQRVPPASLAMFSGKEGLLRWTTPDGQDQRVAYVRSLLTGWVTYISLPVAAFDLPLERSWRILAAAGLLLVLLTLSLTLALGRLLAQPIEALARDAEALGRGEIVALRRTPLREANKVSAALHRASLERQEHEEHIEMLMRELTHRAKNLVSVVQAIAAMTARGASSIDGFLASFRPRLLAFGRSIDLLAGRNWRDLPLEELIAGQVALFSTDGQDQFETGGPEVILKPVAAERLGLALHELSTNAAKYGALSTQNGRIEVRWSIADPQGNAPVFTMTWREHGGPPPREPERKGFGHRLTVVMPAQSLRGKVETSFEGEGFQWRLTCPAHMVSGAWSNPAGRETG